METKTLTQKIVEVLREEIGVEIGEEFIAYENDKKLWTGKLGENGFFRKGDAGTYEYGDWDYIICNFYRYTFKRKPFIPKYGEYYFFLFLIYDRNNNMTFGVSKTKWIANIMDYGMLELGNVFRSEKEALENKDKLLEKLKKLRKGE